jgi:hypothetical protein
MGHRPSSVGIGYIRMQGVAYFIFSLLFARTAAIGSEVPLFSYGESQIYLPFIPGMPLGLAVISLAISFFFFGTLLYNHLMPLALRLAGWLSYPFYVAALASFIISWLGGVAFLVGLPRPWFEVFFWAGVVAFAVLVIHFLRIPINRRRPDNRSQRLSKWFGKAKGLFQRGMPKGRSCLDCGYLAIITQTANGMKEVEPPRFLRFNWGNMKMLPGTASAVCYRGVWNNTNHPDDAQNPYRVLRARYCSKFYPYSGGSPAEHAKSHRTRTNRRWLVGGALIGPYVATSAGFIASETAKSGGVPIEQVQLAFLGLVGLAVVVFVINVVLNRT